MALRPVSDLGLADLTDVEMAPSTAREGDAERAIPDAPGPERRAPRRKGGQDRPGKTRSEENAEDEPPGSEGEPAAGPPASRRDTPRPPVPLGDEASSFLQVMVPAELHERLLGAAFELKLARPRLRHHKTMLGALLWRHVDHRDAGSLREMAALIESYLTLPLSETVADVKVGGYVPASLKRHADGVALQLRRTIREVSVKTLVSALIWRYVDPSDEDAFASLVDLLSAYDGELHPRRRAMVPATSVIVTGPEGTLRGMASG